MPQRLEAIANAVHVQPGERVDLGARELVARFLHFFVLHEHDRHQREHERRDGELPADHERSHLRTLLAFSRRVTQGVDRACARNEPRRIQARQQADEDGRRNQPRQRLQVVDRQRFVGRIVEQRNDDLECGERDDHRNSSDHQALDEKLRQQLALSRTHRLAHANFAASPERLCSRQVRIVHACNHEHEEAQQGNNGDNRQSDEVPDRGIGAAQRQYVERCDDLLAVFVDNTFVEAVHLRLQPRPVEFRGQHDIGHVAD